MTSKIEELYTILIENRNYTKWEIRKTESMSLVSIPSINPASFHLFSGDVFSIDESKNITIKKSNVKLFPNLSGVLILKNNRTFGRNKGGKGKLMYKCIPDDKRIPIFLIPYEMRNVGFDKNFINLYVTFQFSEWEHTAHPIGSLTNIKSFEDKINDFFGQKKKFPKLQTGGKEQQLNLSPENIRRIIKIYSDDYNLVDKYL